MGLDVYVMPLWRYKLGDFRSPIEAATGIRPKIVTADGVEERPVPVGWLSAPAMAVEISRQSFPIWWNTTASSGYYVRDFERLAEVELTLESSDGCRRPGRSVRPGGRELESVQTELRAPDGHEYRKEDPLLAVKEAYLQLREAAELSCRHLLPLIFCG